MPSRLLPSRLGPTLSLLVLGACGHSDAVECDIGPVRARPEFVMCAASSAEDLFDVRPREGKDLAARVRSVRSSDIPHFAARRSSLRLLRFASSWVLSDGGATDGGRGEGIVSTPEGTVHVTIFATSAVAYAQVVDFLSFQSYPGAQPVDGREILAAIIGPDDPRLATVRPRTSVRVDKDKHPFAPLQTPWLSSAGLRRCALPCPAGAHLAGVRGMDSVEIFCQASSGAVSGYYASWSNGLARFGRFDDEGRPLAPWILDGSTGAQVLRLEEVRVSGSRLASEANWVLATEEECREDWSAPSAREIAADVEQRLARWVVVAGSGPATPNTDFRQGPGLRPGSAADGG